jgi:hypothetical protein
LALIKRQADGAEVVERIPRGRPKKDWHLAKPRRGYSVGTTRSNHHDYTHFAYRLFFPDAADHLRWSDAKPMGAPVAWLTRCFNGEPASDSLYTLTIRRHIGEETVSEPKPFSYWVEAGKSAITKT